MQDFESLLSTFKHYLTPGEIVKISMRMLACINREVTFHNIRTAYLALKIGEKFSFREGTNLQSLVLLAIYHTIGFYREDFHYHYNPYDSNPDFFSVTPEIESRYAFSCYYLNDMTPLGYAAKAIEEFANEIPEFKKNQPISDYKRIIYLSALISDYYKKNPDKPIPEDITTISHISLDENTISIFKELNADNSILKAFQTNQAEEELSTYITNIKYSPDETIQLQKLLVYFLDFKSTYTVSHAINTACYSISLGLRCNLSSDDLGELFTSALLHDIGKIATPQRILEAPGKLSPEDMGIMRHHVNHTKRILRDYAPESIIQDAYRHHEKLNGSGYPNHITAENLSLIQRILTVADITSALNDSRSYKGEFSTEKIYRILGDMTEKGELDSSITRFIMEDFEQISIEQQKLLEILRVDFTNILNHYNNFILNIDENLDEIEEIEDIVEDLEEL